MLAQCFYHLLNIDNMNKKIYICILLLLSFCNFCYAQKKILDTTRYIIWAENINLSWDDFLLKSNTENLEAVAFVATGTFWSAEINEKEGIIICYAETYLDRKKSWSLYGDSAIVDTCDSNYLLNHEMGHFNITEIYARESRRLISNIKANSVEEAFKEIEKITKKIMDKRWKEHIKYDKETEHSKNKEKQAKWDKKIAKRLKELEQYKDIAVSIQLRKR